MGKSEKEKANFYKARVLDEHGNVYDPHRGLWSGPVPGNDGPKRHMVHFQSRPIKMFDKEERPVTVTPAYWQETHDLLNSDATQKQLEPGRYHLPSSSTSALQMPTEHNHDASPRSSDTAKAETSSQNSDLDLYQRLHFPPNHRQPPLQSQAFDFSALT